MFQEAISFNQPLNEWNVNAVAKMQYMFHNASSFNSSITDWDVWNVTNMEYMFCNASKFNQDLSVWKFDSTQSHDFTNMFQDSGISSDNYCKIYKAWEKYLTTPGTSIFGKAGMICN